MTPRPRGAARRSCRRSGRPVPRPRAARSATATIGNVRPTKTPSASPAISADDEAESPQPSRNRNHVWRLLICAFDDVVGVVGVARADHLLVELADAGARHFVDKRPTLGKPPPNHLVAQIVSKLRSCGGGVFPQHHGGQWPLLPAIVGHADYRPLQEPQGGGVVLFFLFPPRLPLRL